MNREILEFVILDSFTPANLPMARLAEYMTDLAIILGEREHVHFVELRESSSALVHAIDHEAVPKVHARVHATKIGEGQPEAKNAHDRIERRLRSDHAHGVLRPVGDDKGRLLYFPGAESKLEPEYGPFSEQGQLYGVPISVGGKRQIVNIHLQDGETTHYCDASREIALQLAPLMFNHYVRVYGTGKYHRDTDGNWEMKGFRISQFEELDARPLAETVERLRGITRKVGLDKGIIQKLAEFRHEPSEA